MWFSVSMVLYGLGAIWILLTAVEEEGKIVPIIILSLLWPLYSIAAILMHFVDLPGGPPDDPTGHT
jgi:hypothetical protein